MDQFEMSFARPHEDEDSWQPCVSTTLSEAKTEAELVRRKTGAILAFVRNVDEPTTTYRSEIEVEEGDPFIKALREFLLDDEKFGAMLEFAQIKHQYPCKSEGAFVQVTSNGGGVLTTIFPPSQWHLDNWVHVIYLRAPLVAADATKEDRESVKASLLETLKQAQAMGVREWNQTIKVEE